MAALCDWNSAECTFVMGSYRGKTERQTPTIVLDGLGETAASYENGFLKISFKKQISYIGVYY